MHRSVAKNDATDAMYAVRYADKLHDVAYLTACSLWSGNRFSTELSSLTGCRTIYYYFCIICFLFIGLESMGQQTKAQQNKAIRDAKNTASSASGAFKAYQKFVDNDSVHWHWGGDATLSFNATSLINWVAGGEDQIGVRPAINLFANYKKGKHTFENYATFAYGVLKTGERKAVKNDDRLHYISKLGYQISSKWAYSAAFLARTQFSPGYKYSGENITAKLSDFLAPVNMYLSVGLDYIPNKNISCMLSPVMGRATFVRSDSTTVIIGAGMMTAEIDENGETVQVPHKSRYEFGGGALIKFNGNLYKNKITYSSQVELFSNYMKAPQNMEVFWVSNAKIQVYKNISANMQIELKYDDNQKIKDETTGDLRGAKMQIRSFTGLGLFCQF